MYSKYEISYLFKERGKGVKLNERLLFNHFFNSGAGSASSVYPLVEAQDKRKKQIERGTVKCNRVNDYSKKTSINI